ncbi:HAAS signaling domain-containing protein [Streptomyces sp. KR80]|uniref:HAAS signaling domain-containing protein n=1 Tax=Streptomyces sp. KR80 TaxID=3457426 RepID=UPI003FD5B0B5
MTSRQNQLIEEYLRRLDNASVFLTADRRQELRQEIVEHIDAALEEADTLHVNAVRAVLERLGPPADIVAAELGPRSTGSTPIVRQIPSSALATHKGEPGHEGRRRQRLDDIAAPAAALARPRRTVMLLSGAAAAAVVAGLLALGAISSEHDQPPPAIEKPSIGPSQSDAPSSEMPDWSPTASPDITIAPSEEPSHVPVDPTESAS